MAGPVDKTGERWRAADWDEAAEAEPPLAKWGKSSRPATPDMSRFRKLDVRGRAELICTDWISNGYGAAASVGLFYVFKTAAFAWVWWKLCSPLADHDLKDWAADAFRRVVMLTVLWEVLGVGGSSGPLNGRYLPSPVVAVWYFLRPGAIKMPPGWAQKVLPEWLIGGHQRGLIDVTLYAALVAALTLTLATPFGGITVPHVVCVMALLIALTFRDATVFCAARCDHWLWTLLFLCSGEHWATGCKLVQAAVWFYAGFSKIGPWFPYVVMAMVSNSSTFRLKALRRRTVMNVEKGDLRPSREIIVLSHFGTLSEMTFPFLLLTAAGPILDAQGVVLPVTPAHAALLFCLTFHLFICCHIPMGAPLEWNVACMVSAVVLFGIHGGVSPADLAALPLFFQVAAALLFLVPLYGNLFPKGISFLIAMRYYAGNWPNTQWIWSKKAEHKWQKLLQDRALCKLMHEQVGSFYKSDVVMCTEWRQYAFRAMNLHGHLLPGLLRKILRGRDMDDWRYADGEVVAGIALGWNFGDGYLHDKRLLAVVQKYCQFEPGELYHIRIESCPTLIGSGYPWEIRDAAKPEELWAGGETPLKELNMMQPY
eukprot:TRINITY_DN5063_c0_g1_i1.p1 TRINITY_DN5063_c0_g1~~TRINITY_DN5063_c0_g1_i1.p1  ORF type:complete len:596 (+),score=137.49 TRINITY_DN5063_c0_g1_i1:53-1840(+)